MGFTIVLLAFLALLIWGGYTAVDIDRQKETMSFSIYRAAPWWLAAAVLVTLYAGFTTVDSGSEGVVRRWGQATRQLDPGPHFIIPYAEDVTPVPTQTRIVKPNEDAASKDLQIVHTEVTLAYHVDPAYAMYIMVNLNNDAETRVITPAIYEAIKAVTARYDVQQLIERRAEVRDGIEEFVKTRLAPYHIVAETTSITNFSFSEQYEKAIEAKVEAQQNAERAQNELNKAKIDAQQQVAQAQAQAASTVAKAKAEAEALNLQRQVLTPELLQLRTIEMLREKWDGQLPSMVVGGGQGGTLPILDMLAARNKANEISNYRRDQKQAAPQQ